MNALVLLNTGSENFVTGLGVALSGVVIVFLVLILICAILYAFGAIFSKKPKKAAEEKAVPAPAPEAVPAEEIAEDEEADEEELVAAITAAIAVCTGQSTDGFIVRSFRRVGKR